MISKLIVTALVICLDNSWSYATRVDAKSLVSAKHSKMTQFNTTAVHDSTTMCVLGQQCCCIHYWSGHKLDDWRKVACKCERAVVQSESIMESKCAEKARNTLFVLDSLSVTSGFQAPIEPLISEGVPQVTGDIRDHEFGNYQYEMVDTKRRGYRSKGQRCEFEPDKYESLSAALESEARVRHLRKHPSQILSKSTVSPGQPQTVGRI